MMGKRLLWGIAGFLCLLAAAGCSRTAPPVWLEVEGYGMVVPWRKPGEALRTARETAIEEARLKIWSELLPKRILENGTLPADMGASETDPVEASALLPIGTDPASGAASISTANATGNTSRLSAYETMTIEQLAVINPAFRGKFRHMIGSLTPESVSEAADGRVTVRMRIDQNTVFALARKYLEQQKQR